MSEENEASPMEKIQAEYNQTVGLLGHNKAQQLSLSDEQKRLEERVLKLIKKAANISGSKVVGSVEPIKQEEIKDESAA